MNKENIETIQKQILECEEKKKFVIDQNFKKVINEGITYDGNKFGTAKLPTCIQQQQDVISGKYTVVAPRRVELLLPP